MALNETLSPKQAQNISSQFETIINSAVKQIEDGFNDFFNDMQREWEDKHAVELSNNLKKAMDDVTDHLNTNCDKFIDTLQAIANGYASTGGMGSVSISKFKAGTLAIVANIKETFDGDMFGFKDVDSYDKIAEAIKTLINKLNSTISDTTSKLKSINAFGNQEVINNLASSGGKVIEILQDAVRQVETETTKNLGEAAKAYKTTGTRAADAAQISAK